MRRVGTVLALTAAFWITEPEISAGGFSIATLVHAGETWSPWYLDAPLDAARVALGALPSLENLVALPALGACGLPLVCGNPLRGFARLTRSVTRGTGRAVRTATRTTVRVARRTVGTTARIARGAAVFTAGVAVGAVGVAGSALGVTVPRRKRGYAEFAVTGLRRADAERLASRGYLVIQTRDSSLLGKSVTRIRAPDGKTSVLAEREIIDVAPESGVVRNDLFRRPKPALYQPAGRTCGKRCETFDVTAWTTGLGACSNEVRIGVVDTGVEIGHPSLVDAKVTAMTTRSPDLPPSDKDHGTGVVSLLVGQPGTPVAGLVPHAHVFAVDAFHGTGATSGADVFDLIAALDWLSEAQVKVVNLSLSGPGNALLREAVERLVARNIAVVAASGQPSKSEADVGYPAKYEGVIAVSAIDNRLRPSRVALRGDHISFTAPGVGIEVAQGRDRTRRVEGTSYASPFVAAAYAIGATPNASVAEITAKLAQSAKDLGAPGRDPIFGWGLLQYSGLTACPR